MPDQQQAGLGWTATSQTTNMAPGPRTISPGRGDLRTAPPEKRSRLAPVRPATSPHVSHWRSAGHQEPGVGGSRAGPQGPAGPHRRAVRAVILRSHSGNAFSCSASQHLPHQLRGRLDLPRLRGRGRQTLRPMQYLPVALTCRNSGDQDCIATGSGDCRGPIPKRQ